MNKNISTLFALVFGMILVAPLAQAQAPPGCIPYTSSCLSFPDPFNSLETRIEADLGDLNLFSNNANSAPGGDINLFSGLALDDRGGDINLITGTGGDNRGGNIVFRTGNGDNGSSNAGNIQMLNALVGIATSSPIAPLDVRGNNILLAPPNTSGSGVSKFIGLGEAGGPFNNSCVGYGVRTQRTSTRFINVFMQGSSDASSIPTISFGGNSLQVREDNGTGCGRLIAEFSDQGNGGNGRFKFGSIEYFEDGGPNTITSQGNIFPLSNQTRDLGSASLRWDEVFCRLVNESSDERLKQNIENIDYGLEDVMKLRPVSYEWKDASNRGKFLGLIAQEVQEVIGEVVYDPAEDVQYDEEGNEMPLDEGAYMSIYYTNLVPVLIRSIQELKGELDELKATSKPFSSPTYTTGATLSKLNQNSPNPFSETTRITFELSTKAQNAELIIFDMQGRQVRRVQLENTDTSVEIAGGELEAGMYLYSLIVNDEEVDTKRMILRR